MKIAFFSAALAAMFAVSGKDMRPPFDKSDYFRREDAYDRGSDE